MSMRAWRGEGVVGSVVEVVAVARVEVVEEREVRRRLVYVRARVRAPAMEVVGVREVGCVVSRRVEREERRVNWMSLKGR